MSENWEEQTKRMVEQGKQAAAGFINSGEMMLEGDPEKGFFRVKLRKVQPAQSLPGVTTGFLFMLEQMAAMFNLKVTKHIENQEGKNNV